jgi:hypothetical protein
MKRYGGVARKRNESKHRSVVFLRLRKKRPFLQPLLLVRDMVQLKKVRATRAY